MLSVNRLIVVLGKKIVILPKNAQYFFVFVVFLLPVLLLVMVIYD